MVESTNVIDTGDGAGAGVDGGVIETAIERQEAEAQQEKGRFDHEEIEAGNREFID